MFVIDYKSTFFIVRFLGGGRGSSVRFHKCWQFWMTLKRLLFSSFCSSHCFPGARSCVRLRTRATRSACRRCAPSRVSPPSTARCSTATWASTTGRSAWCSPESAWSTARCWSWRANSSGRGQRCGSGGRSWWRRRPGGRATCLCRSTRGASSRYGGHRQGTGVAGTCLCRSTRGASSRYGGASSRGASSRYGGGRDLSVSQYTGLRCG